MKKQINWLEWEKEAFEKAKKEKKPILLDIHGVWCHWCHEMEKNTYSDPHIIEEVTSKFIPVRVDTDRRPDINDRYNQGGWPTTAFLDPDGQLLGGATYIPPGNMKSVLNNVLEKYRKGQMKAAPYKAKYAKPKTKLDRKIIVNVVYFLFQNYDRFFGGFGYDQKFPMADSLELIVSGHETTNNRDYLDIVEKSLKGMEGGLLDKEAGGFFRYSVTRDWSQPHYEKMLGTNSELLMVYLKMHEIANDKKYLDVARKTVSYILGTLADRNGGLYASQDADGEQAYYGLSLEERKQNSQPYVDRTVYADLNGLGLLSLIKYFEATKDKKVKIFIEKTLEMFLKKYYSRQNGFAHYYDSKPCGLGLLADNFRMAHACLRACKAFRKKSYLVVAKESADFIIRNFHDTKLGGFYDRVAQKDDRGRLRVRIKKITDNSRLAMFLIELSRDTKKKKYRDMARKALASFADAYPDWGFYASEYALAVDMLLNENLRKKK